MNSPLRDPTVNARRVIILVLAGFIILAGLFSFLNYRFLRTAPDWSYMLTPWNAVRLWITEGFNPYGESTRMAAQDLLYGRPAVLSAGEHGTQFVYPLPAAAILLPFGLLPYEAARTAVMTLVELSLILMIVFGVLLSDWKPGGLLFLLLGGFSILWLPGLQAVVTADIRVFFLMLQFLALWLYRIKRDTAAGIVSSVAFSGPGLIFPVFVFQLVTAVRERRWNYLAGWIAALVALIGLSFRAFPNWPAAWFREMLRWMTEEHGLVSLSDFRHLLNPYPIPFVVGLLFMGLIVSYLMLEWRLAGGKGDSWNQWTLLMTVSLSQFLFLLPSISIQVALLPVLCLIFSVWDFRRGRKASWLIAGSLVLFLAYSWGWFYTAGEGSFFLLYGPPLLAVLGLWWIRWWKLHDGLSMPMDYLDSSNGR